MLIPFYEKSNGRREKAIVPDVIYKATTPSKPNPSKTKCPKGRFSALVVANSIGAVILVCLSAALIAAFVNIKEIRSDVNRLATEVKNTEDQNKSTPGKYSYYLIWELSEPCGDRSWWESFRGEGRKIKVCCWSDFPHTATPNITADYSF